MIALVDCNSFYVSCERSFNPALEGKPVVVLSNNDGNIIARSDEVKDLGIKMAAPYFQIRELLKQHNVAVFSSNYTLYGDMSARIMATLGRFVEHVEVYSIDEAFLDLTGYESVYPDLTELARTIRQTIAQWQRVPVGIGIAPTKTLAKVANKLAKQSGGICLLDGEEQIEEVLRNFPVDDLWGIGRRYASFLKHNHIKTAWDLRNAPDEWLSHHLTVNGLRLAHELRGMPCKLMEPEPAPKQAICSAPSFGRMITDLATMSEALTTHVSRAAEKLRRQESAAGVMTVFIHTNRFRKSASGEVAKQYYNSRTIELPHPSASTQELAGYAQAALKSIFQFGYHYQKVGVILSGLVPVGFRQSSLFTDAPDERLMALSQLMDKLNDRHGRDRVRLAGAGFDPSWHHRRQHLSKRYTTQWDDILPVS